MVDESQKQQRVNLRKSHPFMFRSIIVIASMHVALGLNFWGLGFLPRPTFEPYGIPTQIIATVFLLLGVTQIVFITVMRDLRIVRLILALSVGWMMFWGLSNTQQVLAGDASLQLPILYVTISILQVPLLIESPVNPFTEKR